MFGLFKNNKQLVSINPARNYEIIGYVDISTADEVKLKVEKAKNAQKVWERLGVSVRVDYLRNIYNELLKYKDDLALLVTQEMGFPLRYCHEYDIEEALKFFDWYLRNSEDVLSPELNHQKGDEKHSYMFQAFGVSAVIVPWNYPVTSWILGVIPNLIVGNSVVFKHAEECSLVAQFIEKIFSTCSLPEGTINHVYGDGRVGEILTNQDIDLIYFTGNTRVARKIYKKSGERFIKCILETGGSAPGIIFDDVDVDRVLPSVYKYRFSNSGQSFDGLKRLLIHKNIAHEFINKLTDHMSTLKVGDPQEESTDLGPLVSKKQLDLADEQLQDAIKKGAKVIYRHEGDGTLKGAYFMPVILENVTVDMCVWKDEVLAPILPIVEFVEDEEAINLANFSEFGSGGYLYTQSMDRINRLAHRLETGMLNINETTYRIPQNYYGGIKKSGIGKKNGVEGLHDLCNIKLVSYKSKV